MFAKKKKETTNEGLSLAPGVSVLETEKGTVLFDGRQGRYFQLNELGLIVVKSLGEAMGVDAKTADADVRAFLAQIKELGVAALRSNSSPKRPRKPTGAIGCALAGPFSLRPGWPRRNPNASSASSASGPRNTP